MLAVGEMRVELDKSQRKELAKLLYDIGKFSILGLVVGQMVSPTMLFRPAVFVYGVVTSLSCFIVGTLLNREEN